MAATAPPQASVPYPAGQPVFVQPGVPPVGVPMAAAAPGTVLYYPQMHGGAGGILMPVQFAQPKNYVYEYKPSSYLVLSLLTVIACGMFSPLTLALSIPALLFSLKSSKSAKLGTIKAARQQGVVAAYLNVAAIIAALVVACVATGLAIGLYAKEYALQNCLNSVQQQYGGELPSMTTNRRGYSSQNFYC